MLSHSWNFVLIDLHLLHLANAIQLGKDEEYDDTLTTMPLMMRGPPGESGKDGRDGKDGLPGKQLAIYYNSLLHLSLLHRSFVVSSEK